MRGSNTMGLPRRFTPTMGLPPKRPSSPIHLHTHINIECDMRRHRLTLLFHTHAANSQGSIETMKLPSGPPLPHLTPAADAGSVMMMLMLERPRAERRPPPTTHQTTYIPNSIHEELHYVQQCSSESGSPLTTFGVLGLHARQQHHGHSSLIHAHDGPST